jgi:stage V sporulation protein B
MRIPKRFLINGLILTATSLFMRIVGVSFNSFISRKIGADGMGLFTLIMSVYGFTVTVASSGVSLASTRLCAEAIDYKHRCAALRRCLLYAGTCGCIAALGLGCGADFIAERLLNDTRCTASLRLLAVSMPFISMSNALNGYFAAVRKVSRSAATQIFEQLFKIFITVWALLYIVSDGIEYACMALVGGGAIAEVASFLMVFILYLIDKRNLKTGGDKVTRAEGSAIMRSLFGITIPVSAAAYIRSALITLEHILIPRGLRKNPATSATALATYGILCGMVMPVIMLPTAILYSFTGLLLPEFAEAKARNESMRIGRMASKSLGMTLIFSIGCAGILCWYSSELGMLIYQNRDAGEFIRIMAPLVPLMYLDHAVDSILKGLGEQLYCMKVNILDAAMSALLVFLLCGRIGIYGYIATIYISEIVNLSLSFARLLRVSDFKANVIDWIIKPIVSIAAAVAFAELTLIGKEGWGGFISYSIFTLSVYIGLLAIFIPQKKVTSAS